MMENITWHGQSPRGRSTSFLINRIASLDRRCFSSVLPLEWKVERRNRGVYRAHAQKLSLLVLPVRRFSGDGCAWCRLFSYCPTLTQWHAENKESDNKIVISLPITFEFLDWRGCSSWICIFWSTTTGILHLIRACKELRAAASNTPRTATWIGSSHWKCLRNRDFDWFEAPEWSS